MRCEADAIPRQHGAGLEGNSERVDIRRAVIFLCDLFERIRKILRRNLACRRKCKSVLRIRRRGRAVGKRIVARIARPRDVDIIPYIFVDHRACSLRDILVNRCVPAVAVV